MIIHTVTTKNFLSLRDCTVDLLSPHLNFFVGSNGSGKTSLLRAIKELTEAFESIGSIKVKTFDHLYNIQSKIKQIDVDVKVSWNTEEEKKAICAFLHTSLTPINSMYEGLRKWQKLSSYQLTSEKYEIFTDWLRVQLTPEKLQFMYTGRLHLTYRGDRGLRLSYTFICEGKPITILMGSSSFSDGTFWNEPVPEFSTSGLRGSDILLEFLLSQSEHLEKDAAENLANKYFADTEGSQLDVETFLLYLSDKHAYLQIESPVTMSQAYQPEYMLLTEMSGIDFTQSINSRFLCSNLFALLLKRACIFTNSVFAPFLQPVQFDTEKVFSVGRTLIDEQDIPYWLFRLKNGSVEDKKRYMRIRDMFKELTGKEITKGGREFDMAVNTVVQFTEQGRSEVSLIDILVTDAVGTISMASQGSGVWEALVLSVFLESNEGRVILLDEPAASLHPNMQHRLIEVLRRVPGQIFIVTHSAHLLPTQAQELEYVYCFQRGKEGTQVFAGGAMLHDELHRIENKLASSINFGNLLFAKGILLVEGATEIGAFSTWFPHIAEGSGETLADLNIALYDTGGKENFPFCLRFLMAYGIPCVAIGDGDALMPYSINKKGITVNNRSFASLWKILQERCTIITVPSEDDPFDIYKQNAALAGFYTYDTSEPIAFEGIPEVQAYLQGYSQNKQKADSVHEARLLAESVLPVPPLVSKVLHQAVSWLNQAEYSTFKSE